MNGIGVNDKSIVALMVKSTAEKKEFEERLDRYGYTNFKSMGYIDRFWFFVKEFFNMFGDYSKKSYRGVSKYTFIAMFTVPIYLVFPFDFISDYYDFIGIIDDFIILKFAFNQINSNVLNYVLWKKKSIVVKNVQGNI
ncbi:MAG: hypothetical protein ACK5LV_06350 [Lachnospirales bacterium]